MPQERRVCVTGPERETDSQTPWKENNDGTATRLRRTASTGRELEWQRTEQTAG
jgi:hypothetical protein